ncbi:hypothetical protein K1719_031100 [Acacia pycnantha]|nr:hypothetical protein K1719_031100 [Acacia pycnantha]
MSGTHPYPPCFSGGCRTRECCAQGNRYSWPELVGKDADAATISIRQTNPLVTVVRVPRGEPVINDFCCNRVFLFVAPNNTVAFTPQVG